MKSSHSTVKQQLVYTWNYEIRIGHFGLPYYVLLNFFFYTNMDFFNSNIPKHSYFNLCLLLQNLILLRWDHEHKRKRDEKEHLLTSWCVSGALEIKLYLILNFLMGIIPLLQMRKVRPSLNNLPKVLWLVLEGVKI